MIVPKYWAEGTASARKDMKSITLHRFGWSDESQHAAETHAQQRADEALARVLSGQKLPRRDPKVPYNGAQGLPIREEIVATYGETVITRNSYGALCLNTPDVLFADVDVEQGPGAGLYMPSIALVVGIVIAIAFYQRSVVMGILGGIAGVFVGIWLANRVFELRRKFSPNPEQAIRSRLAEYLKLDRAARFALYATPAGFRVLAMHRTFEPAESAVRDLFAALDVDPVYATMCGNQRCFRARVSPKPWRIGIAAHMRPRPGVWPIDPERLPIRNEWIRAYEAKAAAFAACRFIEEFGSGVLHPKAREVRDVHDELSRAKGQLPIA